MNLMSLIRIVKLDRAQLLIDLIDCIERYPSTLIGGTVRAVLRAPGPQPIRVRACRFI